VTLIDSKIFNDVEHRAVSLRELSLIIKLTIINCDFTSAFSSLNFNKIYNILVRHYYSLDFIYQVCCWNSLAC